MARNKRLMCLSTILALALLLVSANPLDAQICRVRRVGVPPDGEDPNGHTFGAVVSGDGRWIAFTSIATNLVPGDTGRSGAFVVDRLTGNVERVSVDSSGQAMPDVYSCSISGDGRFVAFQSGRNLWVRDRQTQETSLISVNRFGDMPNDVSLYPDISDDGRFVAFQSYASDLVPNDTNRHSDIFVRDQQTGQTYRVSVTSSGQQASANSYAPSISGDGRLIVFLSEARDLVEGEAKDRIVLHDRLTGQTSVISSSSTANHPRISRDGRFVTFTTSFDDGSPYPRADIHLYSLEAQAVTVKIIGAVPGDGPSTFQPRSYPSDDGRLIAFEGGDGGLVEGDENGWRDIMIYDPQTEVTRLISRGCSGLTANGESFRPSISADGHTVAFLSMANNLVPGDDNAMIDAFVYDGTEYDRVFYLPMVRR